MNKVQKEHAPRSHSSRSSDQENCGSKADHLGTTPLTFDEADTVNLVNPGCVYADVIGVPVLPTRKRKQLSEIIHINKKTKYIHKINGAEREEDKSLPNLRSNNKKHNMNNIKRGKFHETSTINQSLKINKKRKKTTKNLLENSLHTKKNKTSADNLKDISSLKYSLSKNKSKTTFSNRKRMHEKSSFSHSLKISKKRKVINKTLIENSLHTKKNKIPPNIIETRPCKIFKKSHFPYNTLKIYGIFYIKNK